jgi:tellurite resistance protein TerC
MDVGLPVWIFFNTFILAMLALDLFVFHRKAHEVRAAEALRWTLMWILLALAFCGLLYVEEGKDVALTFLAGYLIEKSLSVDNVFLFLTIFTAYEVRPRFQHRILFLGVLGALLMRGIFILVGIKLIEAFHPVIYVFGAFLVWAGLRLMTRGRGAVDIGKSRALALLRKVTPITESDGDGRFFVRIRGIRVGTRLLAALVLIEATDFVFALDSIPAVLAITSSSFIVYTSNVFALLGLRSLYFAVSAIAGRFRFLDYGISAVLILAGVKMLVQDVFETPPWLALSAIFIILGGAILTSIFMPERAEDSRSTGSKRAA